MAVARIHIGTAGWSIPRASAHRCDGVGTHLQRYARVFNCTEINSSFHRPHTKATYEKWAALTPEAFRFAVKMPRTITHDLELRRARAPLKQFLEESAGLGSRRGPLLVQLPPSQVFDARVAARFFHLLRDLHAGTVVCEPRHATWFSKRANQLLCRHSIARVAADPARVAGGERPDGFGGSAYFRLHGSPDTYWSRYSHEYLVELVRRLEAQAATNVWCVFDNTAGGAALENAWELLMLASGRAVYS